MTTERQKVKQILDNMQHYANIGNCDFKKLVVTDKLTKYTFVENGFILEFVTKFTDKKVFIIEDSEVDEEVKAYKEVISFKEFIKFQSEFLDLNFFKSLFFKKIDGALKIEFYKKDKKDCIALAIEDDKIDRKNIDFELSMLVECFNFKYGIFNLCNIGSMCLWNDEYPNNQIDETTLNGDVMLIDLQLFK